MIDASPSRRNRKGAKVKLTNTIRDAFIRSVMDDTPSIDYAEQIRDAAMKAAVSKMPPKVASLWKDKELRQWVRLVGFSFDVVGGVSLPAPVGDFTDEKRAYKATIEAEISTLLAKAEGQRKERLELKNKIKGAAYGYTTRKALADAMPEFAKYLPADEAAANRSLPVVANVVADFVKAGWPKGKK
jgi:hypothetical protein